MNYLLHETKKNKKKKVVSSLPPTRKQNSQNLNYFKTYASELPFFLSVPVPSFHPSHTAYKNCLCNSFLKELYAVTPQFTYRLPFCPHWCFVSTHYTSSLQLQHTQYHTHQPNVHNYPPTSFGSSYTGTLILMVTLQFLVSFPLLDKIPFSNFQSFITTLAPFRVLRSYPCSSINSTAPKQHQTVKGIYIPNFRCFTQKLSKIKCSTKNSADAHLYLPQEWRWGSPNIGYF